MADSLSAALGDLKKRVASLRPVPLQEAVFAESRINEGMNTSIDPTDIPNGALQLALNARCRFDKTSRRTGSRLLTPTKPDSDKILGLYFFQKNNGDSFFIRATAIKLYYRDSPTWTEIVAAGTPISGSTNDRFTFVSAFDRLFFTNNGDDDIKEIVFSPDEYDSLSADAPQFRFLTAFNDRLLGAYKTGLNPDPTMVGWSGQNGSLPNGIADFDPAVNETAGFQPLIESPGDRSDFISGIMGLTNIAAIVRQKSVWLATKQPVATAPFNFYAAYPGLGSDCPYTIKVVLNALAWLDTRTKTVYAYSPGSAPEPIGRNIEKDIIRSIDDVEQVFGSYGAQENEYTIAIPVAASNYVKLWTYNFRTNAWVYDERENISALDDVDLADARLSINDLVGTINELLGTIDGLSPSQLVIPTRVYGRTDGEILVEDEDEDSDPAVVGSPNPTSGLFVTELDSKVFTIPTDDIYITVIRFTMIARSTGGFRVDYRKEQGDWIQGKPFTYTADMINKRHTFIWRKNINCEQFEWRIVTSAGKFDLVDYQLKVNKSGETK